MVLAENRLNEMILGPKLGEKDKTLGVFRSDPKLPMLAANLIRHTISARQCDDAADLSFLRS